MADGLRRVNPMNGEPQTCALRALMICDGDRCEMPDRELTMCWCEQERIYEAAGQSLHRRLASLTRRALEALTRIDPSDSRSSWRDDLDR
jgi:hypothetical protein